MAGLLNGYRPIGTPTFTTTTFDELARLNRERARRRGLPVAKVTTGFSTPVGDSIFRVTFRE